MNDIQRRISAAPSGAVLFEARLAAGLIHNFDGILSCWSRRGGKSFSGDEKTSDVRASLAMPVFAIIRLLGARPHQVRRDKK
ncbi:hypothetical protein [Rhizobium sp. BK377]|uniref:hypothetical protein n=1 Tax=Rhizobium sp. BK377 TaxID=2587058 RepID=UPI001611AF08|nr:hypothetical protein [Rhizobium sp. BK377]MBB3463310.1 hypothetical protein [Rhizobium sp. BK377]